MCASTCKYNEYDCQSEVTNSFTCSSALVLQVSKERIREKKCCEEIDPTSVVCSLEVATLHVRRRTQVGLLFTCVKAYKENKLHSSTNLETTYISTGYSNWKDASVRIAAHEASACHKDSVLRTITLPATTRDIGESLSAQQKKCFLYWCVCNRR